MAYYLEAALVQLRNEINAAHPKRDKTSDGWIGDTAHAARKSDHNPDYASGGVVRAIDIDKDGIDTAKLLKVACSDGRVEYVIWNRKIYTRQNGFRPQAYNGSNPHDKHMHISGRHGKTYENNKKSWGYAGGGTAASKPTVAKKLTIGQLVDQVFAGKWGKEAGRDARLKAAGYDPASVNRGIARRRADEEAERQKEIANLTVGQIYTRTTKNIGELVDEVLAGKWGNNPERAIKLRAAGWSPTVVQEGVVRRLGRNNAKKAVRPTNEVIAQQIIAGQWGDGPERRRRLTAAGYDYDAVQAEVRKRL
jgi:hypothetical protein